MITTWWIMKDEFWNSKFKIRDYRLERKVAASNSFWMTLATRERRKRVNERKRDGRDINTKGDYWWLQTKARKERLISQRN